MLNPIDKKSIGKPGRNRFKVGVVSKWADGRNVIRTATGWAPTSNAASFKGGAGSKAGSSKKGSVTLGQTVVNVKTKKILRVVRKI